MVSNVSNIVVLKAFMVSLWRQAFATELAQPCTTDLMRKARGKAQKRPIPPSQYGFGSGEVQTTNLGGSA
jgi:hypothetical protein